jgi:hypothetical protein
MSGVRLVVMRLADMHRMHPQQDNSRTCDLCDAPVGIYPSGQAQLEADPTTEIACSVCAKKEFKRFEDTAIPVADPKTILQESRDSFSVKKAQKARWKFWSLFVLIGLFPYHSLSKSDASHDNLCQSMSAYNNIQSELYDEISRS